MKVDWYTKSVLTIIAVALSVLAFGRWPANSIAAGPQAANDAAGGPGPSVEFCQRAWDRGNKAMLAEIHPQPSYEEACLWSRRLMEAQEEVAKDRAEKSQAIKDHIARVSSLESRAHRRLELGDASHELDEWTAAYYRLEAERMLRRAEGK